ncbi:unnamed protein product [Debaryomyces tyrocola]|nr:unnamed protein product [Debaryomyces tyrocola]
MNEYYEPTLLFRQNAVKKYSPELSPVSSMSSLELPKSNNSSSSWLLDNHNPKDTEILNKSCSLNRLNIKSNYWKIPDNDMSLTSMALLRQEDSNKSLLGISSANDDSNLFIYELDLVENYLTHNNTISLPNVHAMRWVPQMGNNELGLITGNSKGYAHLLSIPNSNEEGQSAEIVKRFNHRKHLKSINKDPSIASHTSTDITKLNFMDKSMDLLSLYDNNLFLWDVNGCDSQVRPKPISISSIPGIVNFDPIPHSSNLVGICGQFGVSLFDTRQPKFSVPSSVMKQANKRKLGANVIRWSPDDDNVFAASHMDGVIRLWDIRKQEYFASLDGHQGKKIISIEWNKNDLFSGGRDGNIVHWDLTSDINEYPKPDITNCGLKEGLNSVKFNPVKNSLEKTINQRQCGTVLPASNTNIVDMCSVSLISNNEEDVKVLSIDSSSFLGLHSKIFDAVKVNINSEKTYYTDDDISLLLAAQQSSLSTLVNDSTENVTQPLTISRMPTTKIAQDVAPPAIPTPANVVPSTPNMSSDTLTESPDEFVDVDDIITLKEPKFSLSNYNDSVFSVDSNHDIKSSPLSTASRGSFGESSSSLSTNPTIVEASPISHKRDPSDIFNFKTDFDFGLGLNDYKFDESLVDRSFDRMLSLKTNATNYYSVYSS